VIHLLLTITFILGPIRYLWSVFVAAGTGHLYQLSIGFDLISLKIVMYSRNGCCPTVPFTDAIPFSPCVFFCSGIRCRFFFVAGCLDPLMSQVGHTLDACNRTQSPPSGLPHRSTPHLSPLTHNGISISALCLPGCRAHFYSATPPLSKTRRGVTCISSSLGSQPVPVSPAAMFSVEWSSYLACCTLLLIFLLLRAMGDSPSSSSSYLE
jgi:hypothetical protein